MAQKRKVEVFSLSFLDVICCGFGAVILLYTIINAQVDLLRSRRASLPSAQVSKLQEEVLEGERNLVRLRNQLQQTDSDTVSASSRAKRLIEELQKRKDESSVYDETTLAKRERIEKLKADVKALEEENRRLEASAKIAMPRGERAGAGRAAADRRYITGLTLRGKRILVLLDRSASMLDDDLVNIIRLRNSAEGVRRSALKWRRAVDIASWIAGQIPGAAQFQFYSFNVQPAPLLENTAGKWLDGSDPAQADRVIAAIGKLLPQDGTSLVNAFHAVQEFSPAPDQLIVITDGLPTQGATPPALRRYIDANARAKLFDDAVRSLPRNLPVSVVLLPMKGDLPAPHRFWMLARDTKGAFVMPSPDWP